MRALALPMMEFCWVLLEISGSGHPCALHCEHACALNCPALPTSGGEQKATSCMRARERSSYEKSHCMCVSREIFQRGNHWPLPVIVSSNHLHYLLCAGEC